MNYWTNVETVSGLEGRFWWAAPLFLLVIIAIIRIRPGERRRVRTALVLFGLSIVGLLCAAGFLSAGMGTAHWIYICLRAVATFMMAMAVVNVASVFTFTIALRKVRLEPPEIAQDLIIALIYAMVAIGVLAQCGVNWQALVSTSAVLTAVIGLSLQDSLGNIIGGTFLQAEQMIRVGDWIKVDNVEGKVKAIRWRHTSIETRNWDTVIIPNSTLVKAQVMLVGRNTEGELDQQRRWVYFQVSLHYTPGTVIETVERALMVEPIQCVARKPEVHCLLVDFKDGEGVYAVRYWLTDLAKPDPVDSQIRLRVFVALHRANIPIASPSQTVLVSDESTHRDRLASKDMALRLEALRNMEIFQSLTDDEREELAGKLMPAPFVRGEAITKQGAEAHCLYIMTDGEADVRVEMEGVSRKVGTLRGGEYFGEMGLMTGEPRTATIIAMTNAKCYQLSKDAFEEIVRRRPEIAEEIAVTLARRRMGLDAAREEASEESTRDRMRSTEKTFLRNMRNFFGLAGFGDRKTLN
jgi:small-conductance mechanosensitive channel/CRP-like cAMP-binding protein